MTTKFKSLLIVSTCMTLSWSLSGAPDWDKVNGNHPSAKKFAGYKSTSAEMRAILDDLKSLHVGDLNIGSVFGKFNTDLEEAVSELETEGKQSISELESDVKKLVVDVETDLKGATHDPKSAPEELKKLGEDIASDVQKIGADVKSLFGQITHHSHASDQPASQVSKVKKKKSKALPTSHDLSGYATIFDQGDLGSCTANSISGAVYIRQVIEALAGPHKKGESLESIMAQIQPASRLQIYYGERQIEGTINEDSGASIGDGIHLMHTQGAAPESVWPYDVSKFTVRPSAAAVKAAYSHKLLDRNFVTHDAITPGPKGLPLLKAAIASGNPVSFGIGVYDSFESEEVANTGKVPMPNTATESLLGGHAVLALGFDDSTQTILCANSWGTGWGAKGANGKRGFFHLPYAYFTNPDLMDEAWVVSTAQKPAVK